MKKSLLTLALALASAIGVNAQTNYEWTGAQWNTPDGKTYADIEDFNNANLSMTFTFNGYTPVGFNLIGLGYDIFVDGSTEAIPYTASSNMGKNSIVTIDYKFVEGHSYKLVAKEAVLVAPNFETYVTDTVSTYPFSSTISFTIEGPEVVKTIDVEGTMSLDITDQYYFLTYSLLDANEIASALGISNISEATIYGLNGNGSYNSHFIDPFDGWRDADGEFTVWSGNAGGGVYSLLGHNPYPAVYSIKLNETADTITYFFYDYWRDYVPDEPGEVPGTGTEARRRVPTTSYNNVVWDWYDAEADTTYKYTRSYRVNEGEDYKAGFIIKANKKAVIINATLHFVSQEDFAGYLTGVEAPAAAAVENDGEIVAIYSLDGTPQQALRRGINIVRYSSGRVAKVLK